MGYPFEPFKIDSKFNQNVSYGKHEGLDLNGLGGGNTDCGTEIKSISNGKCVHMSQSTKDYGNLAVIETTFNGVKHYIRYCHLMEVNVREGNEVKIGQRIGTMGSTGNSTFCHLHLDILKKKPSNWRYYTQKVLDWFVDPIVFIKEYKGEDISDVYKGLDLSNRESMKKAVDKWHEIVHEGKYVLKTDVDEMKKTFKTDLDSANELTAQKQKTIDEWVEWLVSTLGIEQSKLPEGVKASDPEVIKTEIRRLIQVEDQLTECRENKKEIRGEYDELVITHDEFMQELSQLTATTVKTKEGIPRALASYLKTNNANPPVSVLPVLELVGYIIDKILRRKNEKSS